MKQQRSLPRVFVLTIALLVLLACNGINPRITSVPTQTPLTSITLPFTPTVTLSSEPSRTPTPVRNSITQQNPQRYRVEFISTIKNNGFTLDKLLVYQARPIAWDGQKDINIELVSPLPTREGTDPTFGNGLYYWDIKAEKPGIGGSLPVTFIFTYTAYEIKTNIDPNEIQPYDKNSPLYKLYTRPEKFIESTDPQIIDIANQVSAGEENPYLLAKKFYDYIIQTAHYRLVGKGLLGAKALLTNGEGECGDYSSLFIALARAKGIPARSVVGFWAVSGIEQTHVWAEFYLEGIGWVPVDPTIGQQSAADKKYYFGNMDNQRVILEKGFNIPLDPPGPDGFLAPLMQGPYFWFWGDGNGDDMSFEVTSWNVTQLPLTSTTAMLTSTPVTTVTFSVDVPGDAGWVDTGLRVTAGQNLGISASGIVNTSGGREGSNSGPNGQTAICQTLDDNSSCIINGAPYGLLVGRIGEGAPFRVGASLGIAAPASGTLFLMINDNYSYYDDNSGSYQVNITLR